MTLSSFSWEDVYLKALRRAAIETGKAQKDILLEGFLDWLKKNGQEHLLKGFTKGA